MKKRGISELATDPRVGDLFVPISTPVRIQTETSPLDLKWADWEAVFDRTIRGEATLDDGGYLLYLADIWEAAHPTSRAAWAEADRRARDDDPPLARALGRWYRHEQAIDWFSSSDRRPRITAVAINNPTKERR